MDGLETERGLNRGAPLAHAPDSDAGTEERDDGFKSASFTGGYHHLVESRWPEPPGMAPGSIVWVHVQFPIVEGEQPTPFQRVAAVSDFGNALANHAADWDDPGQRMRASYINTDISVHLLRPPAGEWLCLVADRSTHINGVGFVRGKPVRPPRTLCARHPRAAGEHEVGLERSRRRRTARAFRTALASH